MGKTKKSQQKAKSKQTLITEQSHDRMNYLSQLSLCAAVDTSNPQMQSLSAFYAQSAFKTSLRTQSKVTASYKRIYCQKCSCTLVHGVNCISRSHLRASVKYTRLCNECKSKVFPSFNKKS
ncbi:hypothetical protein MIR68_008460 [Amoeboaphelidium protococcarum]|nr:hypothetical protein MIR68_008460 [Amoeboaphelidium protococcarum]